MLHGDGELYYLMRVLRNTFLTNRRTAARRPVTAATFDDTLTADPRPMGRPERALEVQEASPTIAELPEDRRLALVAVDVLGLSYREAARALRVREATITTRLFRARKQLVERFVPSHTRLTPRPRSPRGRHCSGRSDGKITPPAESCLVETCHERVPPYRIRAGRLTAVDRRAGAR